MTGRVAGKTALVTGAAQGIGAACAWRLAREGSRVLLTDINSAGVSEIASSINKELGAGTAAAFAHDVSVESQWAGVIREAERFLGGLSILVNNAGIVIFGSIEEISLADWRRTMAINADGVFIGIKSALPLMRKSGEGSIINISSISAMVAAHNLPSYGASKAAVWMLTKSVALHCARAGLNIRCNSVHPTFIRTPILGPVVGPNADPEKVKKLTRQIPLGRLGEPDDVANAVLYLASDESRFVTGSEIKVDGGISAQ
jgi:NAD(P)-dependent dehydrogenase (short-subunit alcohol dehydrogenase family)